MLAAYQNPTDTMETKWESFQFSFIPSRILSAKKEGGGCTLEWEQKVSIYLLITRKDDKTKKGWKTVNSDTVCFFIVAYQMLEGYLIASCVKRKKNCKNLGNGTHQADISETNRSRHEALHVWGSDE